MGIVGVGVSHYWNCFILKMRKATLFIEAEMTARMSPQMQQQKQRSKELLVLTSIDGGTDDDV